MADYTEELPEFEDVIDDSALGADASTAKAKAATHVGSHAASFKDFGLKAELARAIQDAGFEAPSAVQYECIPKAVLGTDILCQAKSGMGKTAVFVLSILQQLDANASGVQAVVLANVRELAHQIFTDFERFKKYMPSVTASVFFGGVPVKQDVEKLAAKQPTIVIGTPGRIADLVERKALDLSTVKYFVLDECDKLLDELSMRATVQKIYAAMPRTKQVMMLTATLSKDTAETAKKFMHNPWTVLIDDQQNLTLKGLLQYYVRLDEKEKTKKLTQLIDDLEFNQMVVFVRTVERCSVLTKLLNQLMFPAVAIHAGRELKTEERIQRFADFRAYKHRIIVTTNVLSRGVDAERVNVVINYDMPESDDTYLHRVGRAARFDTKGLAVSFVASEEDEAVLNKVQGRFAVQIPQLPEGKIDPASYMAI